MKRSYLIRKPEIEVQVLIDREEPPDPAGLCDGVDYERDLKIRMNQDGTVDAFWNRYEHPSGLEERTWKTYESFWDWFVRAAGGK